MKICQVSSVHGVVGHGGHVTRICVSSDSGLKRVFARSLRLLAVYNDVVLNDDLKTDLFLFFKSLLRFLFTHFSGINS